MSGRVAMPQPWMARTLVHIPGWAGRYVPITQETESPRNVTRGTCGAAIRPAGEAAGALDRSAAAGCFGRRGGWITTGGAAARAGAGGGGVAPIEMTATVVARAVAVTAAGTS